jgi:hypothetical protein
MSHLAPPGTFLPALNSRPAMSNPSMWLFAHALTEAYDKR